MTPTKYHALGLKAKPCKGCGRHTQGGADLCYVCSNNALAAMHIFAPSKLDPTRVRA